jgi:hypothetical protein
VSDTRPVWTTAIALLLVCVCTFAESQTPAGPLLFSCATFPPSLSEADLRAKFGNDRVKSTDVPWGGGEGDYTPGTVLFEGIADLMVQIHWQDAAGKRFPDWVHISGPPTRWRTPAGITVGTDLRTIERLNARPFRMNAFGSDVGGALMSWEGGRLISQDTPDCRVRFRFRESTIRPTAVRLDEITRGDRDVSSAHPAMQAMNPAVWKMTISYPPNRPRSVVRAVFSTGSKTVPALARP